MVVTNADGYRYVVAPMVDGYLWQGLKLDGNLNVTKYQPWRSPPDRFRVTDGGIGPKGHRGRR